MNRREYLHRRREMWRKAKAGQLPELPQEPPQRPEGASAPVAIEARPEPKVRRWWLDPDEREG